MPVISQFNGIYFGMESRVMYLLRYGQAIILQMETINLVFYRYLYSVVYVQCIVRNRVYILDFNDSVKLCLVLDFFNDGVLIYNHCIGHRNDIWDTLFVEIIKL